jgi:hypothetical protein
MSDQSDEVLRIMLGKAARASALASRCEGERGRNDPQAMAAAYAGAGGTLAGPASQPERHKPAFWWAIDREPWKRIAAEIDGDTRADAAATAACDEFMKDFTPEERIKVKARTAALIEKELTMRDLQEAKVRRDATRQRPTARRVCE